MVRILKAGRKRSVLALLTGATVWGLIWYPYRALAAAGLGGVEASLPSYRVALPRGRALFPAHARLLRPTPLLVALALSSGACNIAYVLGMLQGHVMRVLLLFYLATLWTVMLSRVLLGERLSRVGAGVMLLSLTGVGGMLWHPELGWPLPTSAAEWWGLASGFCFALSNVLARRGSHIPEESRTLAMFLGVMVMALLVMLWVPPVWPVPDGSLVLEVLLLGIVLLAANLVAQYGFAHLSANRAAVILLLEPLVAALAAWLLAGEAMTTREYLGGALILGAGLLSEWMEEEGEVQAPSLPVG